MISALVYLVAGQAKIVKQTPAYFADKTTKNVVSACRNAYAKMQSARFSIGQGQSIKRYTFASGQLAGAQEGIQWTYAKRRLTVKCPKGFYQGRVGPSSVNFWLGRAGANPEVLPMQLAGKRNPMDVLIPPASRIRRAGLIAIQGVTADVIEIKSPGLRVSVGIRRDNHLIVDLNAENVDPRGKVLFRSSRSIQWSNVNGAIPATTFHLPGKNPKPIKSL